MTLLLRMLLCLWASRRQRLTRAHLWLHTCLKLLGAQRVDTATSNIVVCTAEVVMQLDTLFAAKLGGRLLNEILCHISSHNHLPSTDSGPPCCGGVARLRCSARQLRTARCTSCCASCMSCALHRCGGFWVWVDVNPDAPETKLLPRTHGPGATTSTTVCTP